MESPLTTTALATAQELCTPASCRITCGLEVVDQLLTATGTVRGEEVDALLDLRWLLRQRQDAEAALALFCQLRRAMEERHYLNFYRLRRWLENQIYVSLCRPAGEMEPPVPLRLDRYCIEAVRHQCLHAPKRQALPGTRARFIFSAVTPSADAVRCT